MAYATPDEVRGRLSFVGPSDPGSASGVTDDQLEEAIDDAQSEIDVRLAVRYPTPFDDPNAAHPIPVPAVVKRMCRDMAAYLATLTFLRGAALDPNAPVALRYVAAQNMLQGIAKGTIDLDLPNQPTDEQPADASLGSGSVINPYEGEMFTPGMFDIGPARGTGGRNVAGTFPQDTY